MVRRKGKGEIVGRPHETEVVAQSVWRSSQEFDRMSDELRREMEESFGGWSLTGWPSWPRPVASLSTWRTPRVDLVDRGTHYEVQAEVPGVPKEKVLVEVSEDLLEIRAQHSEEKSEDKEGAHYREIGRSAFYRSIPLPDDAESDKVEAKLDHGLLTVTLPKKDFKPSGMRVRVK